jgi:hypothetical protein
MSDIFPADLVPVGRFAKEVDRCERTIIRWMDQRDGLPFIKVGRERYIHIPTWQTWLMSRVRQRNPDRRGRRKR